MAERIRQGEVEGIRVGRFPFRINTTCILYRLGSTVIDTGPPNQWRTVRRFLREREVRQVVVTHHHEDHSGNLAAIRRDLRMAIYAPAAALEPLARGFPLRPYQHLVWGRPVPVHAEPVPEQVPVAPGRMLLALPSPGHSSDMTCYLDAERGWLFTGDLYISDRTRYLRQDEDLRTEMESLRRTLAYDFDTLFCSHRGIVSSGKEALRRKLDALESLCERVAHHRREGRGPEEIQRMLLGREDLMTWVTGFHFSKRNLIAGCFALTSAATGSPRPTR